MNTTRFQTMPDRAPMSSQQNLLARRGVLRFRPSAAGYVNGVRYKWVSNLRLYVESAKLGEPTYEEYVALSWKSSFQNMPS